MKQQSIKQFFGKYLSLPQEITTKVPKITIIDQTSCHIENHQGIISFSNSQIIVKAQEGYIVIDGSSFIITMMFKEELFIKGQVEHVQFSKHL